MKQEAQLSLKDRASSADYIRGHWKWRHLIKLSNIVYLYLSK